jgi:hypothetical protein
MHPGYKYFYRIDVEKIKKFDVLTLPGNAFHLADSDKLETK